MEMKKRTRQMFYQDQMQSQRQNQELRKKNKGELREKI